MDKQLDPGKEDYDYSNCGVVYISVGKEFNEYALRSARSLKDKNGFLKAHLFTDTPDKNLDFFNSVSLIKDPHYRSKVDYLYKSPYYKTVYLDTDTRIVKNIGDIFQLLDRFDIAFTHAFLRNDSTTKQLWNEYIPDAFPQVNGGVIAFKKTPQVIALLKEWSKSFHEAKFRKDQVTLRELLWKSRLHIAILPPEYNIRYPKYCLIWKKNEAVPKIMHLRRYNSNIIKDIPILNAIKKVLLKIKRK